jgi:hypothetical protein
VTFLNAFDFNHRLIMAMFIIGQEGRRPLDDVIKELDHNLALHGVYKTAIDLVIRHHALSTVRETLLDAKTRQLLEE